MGVGKKRSKHFFKLKKENEAIKDRIIRDIRTLFKQEDDYYKNNYIEYESSGDRNKSYQ